MLKAVAPAFFSHGREVGIKFLLCGRIFIRFIVLCPPFLSHYVSISRRAGSPFSAGGSWPVRKPFAFPTSCLLYSASSLFHVPSLFISFYFTTPMPLDISHQSGESRQHPQVFLQAQMGGFRICGSSSVNLGKVGQLCTLQELTSLTSDTTAPSLINSVMRSHL